MIAKNCTFADLCNAAGLLWRIEITVIPKPRLKTEHYRFTLRHFAASNNKYIRGMQLGHNGRKTNALCIHAHYRFFERLFKIAPDAVVTSTRLGKMTHTKDTLHENYERLRNQYTNPYYAHTLRDDTCNCSWEDKP